MGYSGQYTNGGKLTLHSSVMIKQVTNSKEQLILSKLKNLDLLVASIQSGVEKMAA